MEGSYTLRADVLKELLMRCTSVKTVRLCLQLGRELKLNWASKLDAKKLPTGSDRPWVSKSKGGLLVLKPPGAGTSYEALGANQGGTRRRRRGRSYNNSV